jgi:arylformamidase
MTDAHSTIYLSHVLSDQSPGFGGVSAFAKERVRKISDGSSSNSETWTLSNHIGTHIDAPRHFSDDGVCIDHFSADDWVFKRTLLLEIPLGAGQLLSEDQLAEALSHADSPISSPANFMIDLLLIKTGFEKYRGRDLYWSANPGVAADVGSLLRQQFPSVRAIGFDFLSLTSAHHREVGREAHRAFLDPSRAGKPVLIIEDMHLQYLDHSPQEVVVAPMRVQNSDGAPVTVFAKIDKSVSEKK